MTAKILPKDISHIVKRALYIKFFTILFLNNFFWVLALNLDPNSNTHLIFSYPKDYYTLTITCKHFIDFNLNDDYVVLTENQIVLSTKVKVLEYLKKENTNLEFEHQYRIALPQENYLQLLKHQERNLMLIPEASLKYLEKKETKEQSYEIQI